MKILWIPHTGWHVPQRAQLFSRALAEEHEVHVTDWVADFATIKDYVSRRYVRNFVYRRYRDGKIAIHGIPRVSPALFVPFLRRFNTALFSAFVQRIVARYAIHVVVGTYVVPPPKAPRLIFDLFDDNVGHWHARGLVASYADEIAATEQAYLHRSDAVVAASSVLADMARAQGPRGSVYHIPNGVSLDGYRATDGGQVRNQLGIKGKLVGVVGNHDKVAELEKVIAAAKTLASEDVTFLIAGRGSATVAARKRTEIEGLSNVLFRGYVPNDEAPAMISALDVGLCPYAKTPGTDAASPMRLLMYAAAGVPTVCTELEEVKRMAFSNVVLVQDNLESFVEGIRQALQQPRARPSQIEAYDMPQLVTKLEAVLDGQNH